MGIKWSQTNLTPQKIHWGSLQVERVYLGTSIAYGPPTSYEWQFIEITSSDPSAELSVNGSVSNQTDAYNLLSSIYIPQKNYDTFIGAVFDGGSGFYYVFECVLRFDWVFIDVTTSLPNGDFLIGGNVQNSNEAKDLLFKTFQPQASFEDFIGVVASDGLYYVFECQEVW